jgi:hypothetical protein
MHLGEVAAIDVSINLRRGDVRVTQHLLNRDEVRTALEKVRREGVPERMRAHVLANSSGLYMRSQDLPHTHARERPAARIQEDAALSPPLFEARSGLSEIDCEGSHRPTPQRNESFLATLPEYGGELAFEIEMDDPERSKLGDSHSAGIGELEQRPVPPGQRMTQIGRLEQALHLVDAQNLRKIAPSSRCVQAIARICHYQILREKEGEVGTDRREITRNRRGRETQILEIEHEGSKLGGRRGRWRAASTADEKGRETDDVVPIRGERLIRETSLEREVVQEWLNVKGPWRRLPG